MKATLLATINFVNSKESGTRVQITTKEVLRSSLFQVREGVWGTLYKLRVIDRNWLKMIGRSRNYEGMLADWNECLYRPASSLASNWLYSSARVLTDTPSYLCFYLPVSVTKIWIYPLLKKYVYNIKCFIYIFFLYWNARFQVTEQDENE